MRPYESPQMTALGSVHELTLAFNKVGPSSDVYTAATGGAIVGSIVPV